ncbi:hypothetical protein PEBR_09445 [Penicillium brasilianum]|uniref:Forkhead domain protein n=1 Tax=Penicillium brasilianum TaxID=104259 RepID=A0A1S9S2L0_PENBI|nr:hypothetical protein PEBR_09445 [Penicillium brasilianum]
MSSQTMTAPAVGHRPPDPGPDTPMYDYGGSQNDASPPTDSRSDSAIRDMHNSAPTSKGLSATPIGIKMESVETQDLAGSESQKHINTQSAAGALLAQLLGNQSAPTNSVPNGLPTMETGTGTGTGTGTATEAGNHQDVKMGDEDGHVDQKMDLNADFSLDFNLQQDGQASASAGMQSMSNGGKSTDDIFAQLDATPQDGSHNGHRGSDAMDLSGPLNSSKSDLDQQPSLLPAFDFAMAPKNAFEALQQNEMLTAAYLSQSADLSALGYQDGSTSVAGSEPRIQAFAKLEFDDGHFYCNTYSFILGRDVRAARAAHQREYQYRQAVRSSRAKSSSGGNTSHTPNRMKREESAAIMGSVVSDRGGIMGFDPDVPPNLSGNNMPGKLDMNRRSSKSSFDGSVVPLHANPAQLQASTDYNALAMQSLQEGNGDPKPVDTLALLPSPDSCPTIPIHPPSTIDGTAAGHRGISRRHVRIAYNFDRNLFEMEVMGRNGAFIGADWLSPGQVRPLHSGDYIQIGGVRIRFLLPDVPIGETGADRIEEQLAEEEEADQGSVDAEHEIDDTDKPLSDSESREPSSKVTKIILKTKDSDSSKAMSSVEAGGENGGQPTRRRGPGRPPKDGIMSKRERAELAREQKMAAKREANGGVTPPPPVLPPKPTSSKAGKTVKESVGAESPPSSVKPAEKRKYTKRKKGDGMDFPLPSTEGGQFTTEQRPEEYVKPPPVKKRKPSRSPSPNYPPESAYTPEDLAKPPYNYAVLIFDALTEAGNPMTLKQIYRALKLKYPYFRFKCETEGWTSSVRHNLNGNSHLFMHAERDGKGWSWQLRPGASVEKEKKRRPSPPPPQPTQASVPPPQHYMPPMPHSYAPPTGAPAPMQNQHQHQHQHQHFQFPSIPPSSSFSAPSAPPPQQQQQHTSPYAPPPPPPPPPPPASTAPPPPALAAVPPVSAPVPVASQPPVPAPVSVPAPPSATPAPVSAPAPPVPVPAPAPAPAPASFPIPSALRGNLPAAFARTIPGTYTSPYASNPAPQAPPQQQPPPQNSQPQPQPIQGPPGQQAPQQHQQQQQHHSPYPPPQKAPSTPQPHINSQTQAYPPPAAPQYQPQHQHPIQQPVQMQHQQHQQPQHQPPPHQHVPPPHHQAHQSHPPPPGPQTHHHQAPPQHQPQHQHHSVQSGPPPPVAPESPSFTERANKAIDDFENVLMEDYEDKNYIREVLRSARARVLGNATESSFPGGEPKDEAVIMDVLRNLVGSLKEE